MSFIGVISNKKCFETIKEKLLEKDFLKESNIIHIHLNSIDNIKNIKFDTVIIEDKLEKFEQHQENINKICGQSNYMLINTDLNTQDITKFQNCSNVITYGLNQEAMVTISSVSENDVLIYWQKDMLDKVGNKIEIEERRIKLKETNTFKIYEIIIIYIIYNIYSISITQEI